MNDLLIEQTGTTPEINLSTSGALNFEGRSYPVDSDNWYQDVFIWLEHFCIANPTTITVNFRFSYVNSGSMRVIMKLLKRIELNTNQPDCQIKIKWFCNDEDMEEAGQLLKATTQLPYEIIFEE